MPDVCSFHPFKNVTCSLDTVKFLLRRSLGAGSGESVQFILQILEHLQILEASLARRTVCHQSALHGSLRVRALPSLLGP